jgi:fumarate reductase subunit D
MTDQKIYHVAGFCSLAAIVVFFIEFPFYLVRGPFPSMTQSNKLSDFAARNATNVMACVLLDLLILSLFMIFAAGCRHIIHRTDPQQEWLGTLFFGVSLVYTTLTLIADSLQARLTIK